MSKRYIVPENIRFEYFSALPNPPGSWPMAIFEEVKSWVDNSGDNKSKQHKVCSIAGYITTLKKWRKLEKLWKQILREYEVPYLHMVDFAHFKLPFDIFKDKETGKEKPKRKLFLDSLINIMQDTQLKGFVSIVILEDLHKFNNERKVNIDPLALNLFTCMAFAGQLYPKSANNLIVEMIIDKLEKNSLIIDKAIIYAQTDNLFKNDCKHIDVHPLHKELSYKNVIPIQAADFLAWEARKNITTIIEWSSVNNIIKTKSLLMKHNYDYDEVIYPRGSFKNLIKSFSHNGIIWNYEMIDLLDQSRNHIWP